MNRERVERCFGCKEISNKDGEMAIYTYIHKKEKVRAYIWLCKKCDGIRTVMRRFERIADCVQCGKPSKREHTYYFLHPDSVVKMMATSCSHECKRKADEELKLMKEGKLSGGPDEFDFRKREWDHKQEEAARLDELQSELYARNQLTLPDMRVGTSSGIPGTLFIDK